MPRKKVKGGKRKSTRKSDQKTQLEPSVDNESVTKLRNWLEDVCKNMDENDMENIDMPEIYQPEIDLDENECNLKELEKPLKYLLRKHPDSRIKKYVKIECEWKKCLFETIDDKLYFNHVHNHLVEIEKSSNDYSCQWNLCRFKTCDYEELIRHLDYHAYATKLKTFGFAVCSLINIPTCQSDSKFRNVIPSILSNYFCYWNDCTESYSTFIDYIQHVNFHINDYQTGASSWNLSSDRIKLKDIKVICHWHGCDSREIPNVFELKRHLKTHTGEKMIGCSNCGHLFSNKQLFINHCVRQVVGQRTFKCAECVKFYPSEKLLKDHMRSHVNKFQCSICGLSCQKKSVLARHIRYRHVTKNKLFACDQCNYRGTTQRDLDSHSNRHKSGDFFKCDVFQCNYSCRTLMALKRHDAREHLGQPAYYICHIYGCSKKFLRGYLLTKHLKTDHNFILAPGHSRFIYKQDEDGFYRLQTKRVENLIDVKTSEAFDFSINPKVSYEVESIVNNSNVVNVKIKQVLSANTNFESTQDSSSEKLKDINDFAIVKSYSKLIKKDQNKN